jgi:hypothetical protein
MGTNCAPLLADLFLYSYESEFLQKLVKDKIHEARAFNFTYRYIDDVLSINNSRFAEFQKEFEDTKRVIKIRILMKNRQHNGLKKVQRDKLRSTKHTYKTKDQVARTPLKTGVNSAAIYQLLLHMVFTSRN